MKAEHLKGRQSAPGNKTVFSVAYMIELRVGGKRGAGVPGFGERGTGSRGPGVWKTRGTIFSPKYEFSSLKWEAKILLAYIAMNINSAS